MRPPRDTAWARLLGIMAALALVLTLGAAAFAQEGEVELEPGAEEAAVAAEGEAEGEGEEAADGEPLPDPLGFRWSTISYNTAEEATDYLVMAGNGWLVNGQIAASGTYNHYSGVEGDDICAVPRELLGWGVWQTTGYGQVELIDDFGGFAGGTIVIEGKLKPKETEDSQAVPALLTLNASIQSGAVIVEPEGALIQLSDGQTFAPVTVPSETCGFGVGGGQVEFVIYEQRPDFVRDDEAAAAAGLATGAAAGGGGGGQGDGGGGGQGGGQGGSGGGNKSGGGNAGSVDQTERNARQAADAAEDKADQKEDQVREGVR